MSLLLKDGTRIMLNEHMIEQEDPSSPEMIRLRKYLESNLACDSEEEKNRIIESIFSKEPSE